MTTLAPPPEGAPARAPAPAAPPLHGQGWAACLAAGWPPVDGVPDLDGIAPGRDRVLAAAASALGVLPIPRQFGGGGGDLLDAASAQRELGRLDPSTAVALNMHVLSVGLLAEHWRHHRDVSWMLMEAIAGGHNLCASAFAEPGGSANILRSTSRAVRTGRGFRVSGVKFPCSLASTAELFCLSAQVEGEDVTIVALCPAAAPGLTVKGEWSSIGMQGSDTARVELDGVEIDRRLVFHEAPCGTIDEIVVGGLVWFAVLIAATYHGVLSGLVEQAASSPPRLPGRLRDAALADATAELAALGATAQGVARSWTEGRIQGDTAMVAAASLRLQLSDVTDRVLADLRPVLGAAVYTRGAPASQRVLDALAAHHHPPSLPVCQAVVAAAGAGRPLSLDLEP